MNERDLPLGIHHVTAMTSDVVKNYEFFTEVLGMRLVKKTVNQDDIHTYHTYYGDDTGSPGTAMTFFDFPNNGLFPLLNYQIHHVVMLSAHNFRVTSAEAAPYYFCLVALNYYSIIL